MKIFAIRDELDPQSVDLAYLIYYEGDKRFYIELPEDADPWETPLLLSSFAKRGERTVNAYWSKLWVQQRIVPSDRQNLGQILRDNGLSEYDEYELLMLGMGRCAQDDYYLVPRAESDLPIVLIDRFQKKVEVVVPLTDKRLLVFFRNGVVRKCDVQELLKKEAAFSPLLVNDALFNTVSVQAGGYGVCWGDNLNLADDQLYENGEVIPLSLDDFRSFVKNRIVNTAEAAELLECSRQNIEDLIRRNKLHPIKATPKNKLFLKNEITQRKWR